MGGIPFQLNLESGRGQTCYGRERTLGAALFRNLLHPVPRRIKRGRAGKSPKKGPWGVFENRQKDAGGTYEQEEKTL